MDRFDSCIVLKGEIDKLGDAVRDFTDNIVNRGLDPEIEAESQFFANSLKRRVFNFGGDMQDVCMVAV